MNLLHFKFIIFFNTVKHNTDSNLTEVVLTDKGPVQGEIRRTVHKSIKYSAFRGIRYGKPPVGYSRFKPPEEAEPWTEVFNATSEATPCPQRDIIDRMYVGDEDCLNLNIYTPRTNFKDDNKKLLPVMVWIHGGGFYFGWTNMSFYGPDFLIENDVVIIAINYRLGPLGFLALNHTNATGNAGLKDQLLALKWVQNNIEKFGGDPNSVTVFGHSAGAASIDYHILSKASEGLFHRSISMSGSHYCQWAYSTSYEAEEQAFRLGQRLGIVDSRDKEELLTGLYNKSARDLVEVTRQLNLIDLPFKPTLEDPSVAGDTAFFFETPDDTYKSKKFNDVPHMTGFSRDEALAFSPGDGMMSIKNTLNSVTSMQNNRSLLDFRNIWSQAVVSSSKMFLSGMSDTIFKKCIHRKQKILKEHSSAPVYYYHITFTSNVSIHKQIHFIEMDGAAHEDEMAYLWYVSYLKYPENSQDPLLVIKDQMTRMWTNFAKFGNPTPDKELDPLLNITWPTSGDDHKFLEINKNLVIKKDPTRSSYFSLWG